MAIKQSKGKLTLSRPLDDYIQEKIKLEDFRLLNIELSHLKVISQLDISLVYHPAKLPIVLNLGLPTIKVK